MKLLEWIYKLYNELIGGWFIKWWNVSKNEEQFSVKLVLLMEISSIYVLSFPPCLRKIVGTFVGTWMIVDCTVAVQSLFLSDVFTIASALFRPDSRGAPFLSWRFFVLAAFSRFLSANSFSIATDCFPGSSSRLSILITLSLSGYSSLTLGSTSDDSSKAALPARASGFYLLTSVVAAVNLI